MTETDSKERPAAAIRTAACTCGERGERSQILALTCRTRVGGRESVTYTVGFRNRARKASFSLPIRSPKCEEMALLGRKFNHQWEI